MDNKEKIKWLKQYKVCGLLANQIENDLARWRSIAEKTSSSIQPVPGGGRIDDKMPRQVEKIIELEGRLNRQKTNCLRCRFRIEDAIAGVEDKKLQLILRYLYVDGLRIDDVAEMMGYSYDWVKEMHIKAIDEIKHPPQTPRKM